MIGEQGSSSVILRRNDAEDSHLDLLMRHSSPLLTPRGAAVASPLTERNSSPSPLRLNRPRSNPRNRTPMRYQSPHDAGAIHEIPEESTATATATAAATTDRHEIRRVTIRPTAGRAVGATLRSNVHAIREESRQYPPTMTKSRKQGPSHRKVRRWNNDNFVNLAAEINSGNKGGRAAQALLLGHGDTGKYPTIYDPQEHTSKAMERLREDESIRGLREKFFEGTLNAPPATTSMRVGFKQLVEPVSPQQMLHRIDARLRRVVVKACENSVPASAVVDNLELFLVGAHSTGICVTEENPPLSTNWWKDILLESPTVTHKVQENGSSVASSRFLFDVNSTNAGFHRLLLHGLCQFHGLQARSSTVQVTVDGAPLQVRLLVAAGVVSQLSTSVKMVTYITSTKQEL